MWNSVVSWSLTLVLLLSWSRSSLHSHMSSRGIQCTTSLYPSTSGSPWMFDRFPQVRQSVSLQFLLPAEVLSASFFSAPCHERQPGSLILLYLSASSACQWVNMFWEDSQMWDRETEICEHVNSCCKSVLPRDNTKPLEAGTSTNCMLELHDFLACLSWLSPKSFGFIPLTLRLFSEILELVPLTEIQKC